MNKKSILGVLIAIALLAFSYGSYLWASDGKNEKEKTEKVSKKSSSKKEKSSAEGKVMHLDTKAFNEKVVNTASENGEWKYLGDKPCVLDFYANWCGPCRMISPYLDDLAKEYADEIYIYKIDVDKNRELAQYFGATSIPLLVFVPMEGQPQAARGALPKAELENAIKSVLLNNK